MIDSNQIDDYFYGNKSLADSAKDNELDHRSHLIHHIKLILPSLAAVLLGLLIFIPHLEQAKDAVHIDITLPKKGELEKLHMEKTNFYITDSNNKVNNFTADNIDETSPGSKIIKLTNPTGIIPTAKGPWYNIEAPVGYYDQNQETLRLEQNVDVIYSDGMMGHTESLTYNFKTQVATSTTPTHADGTLGSLDSEGFEFYNDKNLIIFTGKTHITIDENNLKE